MEPYHYVLSLLPIAGGLAIFFLNVTSRLTRIETDVKWIKKILNDGLVFNPPVEK